MRTNMPPSQTTTTFAFSFLDAGHLINRRVDIPLGAAKLTFHAEGGTVDFTLEEILLQPTDPVVELFIWLDTHLPDEHALLTGYNVVQAARRLRALPGAKHSSALRCIGGGGSHKVFNLTERDADGRPLSFVEACANANIVCSSMDQDRRFINWLKSDMDRIAHALHLDVLACQRLVMRRMAAKSPIGAEVAHAVERSFIDWLWGAGSAAARVHLNQITG